MHESIKVIINVNYVFRPYFVPGTGGNSFFVQRWGSRFHSDGKFILQKIPFAPLLSRVQWDTPYFLKFEWGIRITSLTVLLESLFEEKSFRFSMLYS